MSEAHSGNPKWLGLSVEVDGEQLTLIPTNSLWEVRLTENGWEERFDGGPWTPYGERLKPGE